jgi:hypothetical protein
MTQITEQLTEFQVREILKLVIHYANAPEKIYIV